MKFKFIIFLFLAVMGGLVGSAGVVYQDATKRITLISDGAVRLEYAPDGKFVDDSSFVAVNRVYDPVKATVRDGRKQLRVTTSDFELSYKKDDGPFTAKNLSIKSLLPDMRFTWHPGDRQKDNLKGTYRTLDRYDGNVKIDTKEEMPIEDGILARDGWTLIDDSDGFLFDQSDWAWVKERESADGAQDWYFLCYGTDYKKALKDFTRFAGSMPLPPRYAFGFWWSRYWGYSDTELRALVDDFRSHDIPLDVLVIDMDWHYTEPGKGGWTGYTWNRDLFPKPEGLLEYIKDNDLKITMNLHPADGVYDYEEKYADMCRSMGIDTATTKHIEHVSSDRNYINAWLGDILHPLQDQGVDFWWLDWQQAPYDQRVDSLSNTWWLNYLFFTDMERHGDKRPLLYHRWGGLGNHRYQIGFSGDACITWKTLDFQPYFNHTASNVLYGYWSHDIGGHYRGIGRVEPEMYTRWMQFGTFSPVLRAHSSKKASLIKEPWNFDNETFNNLRDIIKLRYALSPYIYTMAREATETGVSICRPMYYDYPKAQEAYDFRNEYMFGDDILVMPVTAPMDGYYSDVEVWLPEGDDWWELSTGTLLKGGQLAHRRFAIDEYPVYVRAGSIIPMAPDLNNLAGNDQNYELNIFPGGDGQFTIYEDNGNDKDWVDQYATTAVSARQEADRVTVTVAPRRGSYSDMPEERGIAVKIHGRPVASRILVDGKPAAGTYDGHTLTTLVELPSDPTVEHQVVVEYPSDELVAGGEVGAFRRFYKGTKALKETDSWSMYCDDIARIETTPERITYYPEDFTTIMDEYRKAYVRTPELLLSRPDKADREARRADFLRRIDFPIAR